MDRVKIREYRFLFFNLLLEPRRGKKIRSSFYIRKERERERERARGNKEPRSLSVAIKWRAVNVKRGKHRSRFENRRGELLEDKRAETGGARNFSESKISPPSLSFHWYVESSLLRTIYLIDYLRRAQRSVNEPPPQPRFRGCNHILSMIRPRR